MREENIKTYVRVRPNLVDESATLKVARSSVTVLKNNENYSYTQVFDEDESNRNVFMRVMWPHLPSFYEGYNVSVLAYGQTASGKTYTMKGTGDEYGIIPLTLNSIFEHLKKGALTTSVKASYFEIYNQNIIDLLSVQPSQQKGLQIREDGNKKLIIQDLQQEEIKNEVDALKLYDRGEQNRKIASNNINVNSSRSHTIFRITLTKITDSYERITSMINLVDLAGSESISKTNAVGKLKTESDNINKSLLALSRVIRELSYQSNVKSGDNNQYINFRDSKLTRILQTSLHGNSKTSIICTVNPTQDCLHQTINTLKFGVKAGTVKMTPSKNYQNENEEHYQYMKKLFEQQRKQKEETLRELACTKQELSLYIREKETIEADRNKLTRQLAVTEQQLSQYRMSTEHNQKTLDLMKIESERHDQERSLFREETDNVIQGLEKDKQKLSKAVRDLEMSIRDLQTQSNTLRKQLATSKKNEDFLMERVHTFEHQVSYMKKNITQSAKPLPQPSQVKPQKRQSKHDYPPLRKKDPFEFLVPKLEPPSVSSPYTLQVVAECMNEVTLLKSHLRNYTYIMEDLHEVNEQLETENNLLRKDNDELREEVSKLKTQEVEEDIESKRGSSGRPKSRDLESLRGSYYVKSKKIVKLIRKPTQAELRMQGQIRKYKELKEKYRNMIIFLTSREETLIEGYASYVEEKGGNDEREVMKMLLMDDEITKFDPLDVPKMVQERKMQQARDREQYIREQKQREESARKQENIRQSRASNDL